MTDNYDDIINLPHHTSTKHPRMSMRNRAAQFAPFAALTGHGAAIEETARQTDVMLCGDENLLKELDDKLALLKAKLDSHPRVKITHFVPDKKKDGGSYESLNCVISKIDEYNQQIITEEGFRIPLNKIQNIEGEIF